jgi:hypothetical protein
MVSNYKFRDLLRETCETRGKYKSGLTTDYTENTGKTRMVSNYKIRGESIHGDQHS